eukprot:g836.t1
MTHGDSVRDLDYSSVFCATDRRGEPSVKGCVCKGKVGDQWDRTETEGYTESYSETRSREAGHPVEPAGAQAKHMYFRAKEGYSVVLNKKGEGYITKARIPDISPELKAEVLYLDAVDKVWRFVTSTNQELAADK